MGGPCRKDKPAPFGGHFTQGGHGVFVKVMVGVYVRVGVRVRVGVQVGTGAVFVTVYVGECGGVFV